MGNKFKNVMALSLLPQIVLIKWLGSHPDWVEHYYSTGFYPWFSRLFRSLLGWIPFSIGDIIYVTLIMLGIRYIYTRRRRIRSAPLLFLRDVAMVLSIAYLTFHLSWGMNYYRLPLAQKLGIGQEYSKQDLLDLTHSLIEHTNGLQYTITGDTVSKVHIDLSQPELFDQVVRDYQSLGKRIPILNYEKRSVKTSLISTLLTYMGYAGYLNPFTHEAQVNALLPHFRFPVVVGHEIGHQLGYAAEREANMIGYLVTQGSGNPQLQYAASAYALGYCLVDIRGYDPSLFNSLYAKVNKGVQRNYGEMDRFWSSYENPMEPLFKSLYSNFLKANDQADGILGYNAVVGLLVNYHKKYPPKDVKKM
ncbi:MAG: DUF3810 domain-containing protein [Flavobacteriaceae bacterium]